MFLDKDEIIVCDRCGIPLIWTFKWAYNEYYCINCGGHWGMLGAGAIIKTTPELKIQQKKLQKLFNGAFGRYLLPNCPFGKNGCKKCNGCNHQQHLSKRERLSDKIATKILESMLGCWIPVEVEDLR